MEDGDGGDKLAWLLIYPLELTSLLCVDCMTMMLLMMMMIMMIIYVN